MIRFATVLEPKQAKDEMQGMNKRRGALQTAVYRVVLISSNASTLFSCAHAPSRPACPSRQASSKAQGKYKVSIWVWFAAVQQSRLHWLPDHLFCIAARAAPCRRLLTPSCISSTPRPKDSNTTSISSSSMDCSAIRRRPWMPGTAHGPMRRRPTRAGQQSCWAKSIPAHAFCRCHTMQGRVVIWTWGTSSRTWCPSSLAREWSQPLVAGPWCW